MKSRFSSCFKRYFTTQNNKPKLCIIGAGPAGFYAAQHIIKKFKDAKVDIIEKLPVPYGLVRFGVAPDHPEVKNVINTFSKTAVHPNVRFIGNVSVGKDVTINELSEAYHAVLLTYGAHLNRKLNIPGEDLKNVIPARRIVGWYNGVPEDSNLDIDLSGETAVIFGQGNVAIDVARILLSPIDSLKNTDITQHALEILAESKVKEVYLIGRRGPLQAAFTIKELREMLKLANCKTVWRSSDFEGVQNALPSLDRPRKRITELMLKSLSEDKANSGKVFKPIFYRSPLEITGPNKVEKVLLGVNQLEGDDIANQRAVLTDKTETIDCQLAVSSIGYKAVQIDKQVPFNESKGIIINKNGKIEDGLYASGWVATGPTGVILTTMNNAFVTADLISKDFQNRELVNKPGFELVKEKLERNNVQIVTWNDWLKIDEYEKREGQNRGKPREKVTDIKKMLEIAS